MTMIFFSGRFSPTPPQHSGFGGAPNSISGSSAIRHASVDRVSPDTIMAAAAHVSTTMTERSAVAVVISSTTTFVYRFLCDGGGRDAKSFVLHACEYCATTTTTISVGNGTRSKRQLFKIAAKPNGWPKQKQKNQTNRRPRSL